MKTNCLNCGSENPKNGMKTCCRKCADELKKNNSRENRSCLFCKSDFEVRKKDTKQICSEECRRKWVIIPENINIRIDASKKAVKEKFGVDNVFQLESIKNKSKETKLEKYGDENYNNTKQQVITIKKNNGDDYYIKLSKMRKEITLKKYGVEHHFKLPEFINKMKDTNLQRYGVESVSQLDETKQKIINTTLERFGVKNASQNKKIKQKKKKTSLKNFGVFHHLKDYDLFQKHLKSQYKVFEYKNTGINYQGSYEKYFLELLEEKGFLLEVLNGQSFEYTLEGEKYIYHTDFLFRGQNIEIKSMWTYNNNGKNIKLQELNEVKWQSVRDKNEDIVVLIGKEEIKGFVKALK
jgi:hypothetical protein